MKIQVQQRIAVKDGMTTHYIYKGDRITLLHKDGNTFNVVLVSISASEITIVGPYGTCLPFVIPLEDIEAISTCDREQVAKNEE